MCNGFWKEEPWPSPKSHVQDDGLPDDVSVKLMVWSGCGEGGENVKEAAGAATFVTVTECEVWLEPNAFWAVSETVNVPTPAKMCEGFSDEAKAPSPKLQNHDVGPPEDVSVKLTLCPGWGDGGEKVNAAAGAEPVADTTTCWELMLEPCRFEAVSVTV